MEAVYTRPPGRGREEIVVSYMGERERERRGIGRTRDVDGIHSGNAYLITTDWTILRSHVHTGFKYTLPFSNRA